MTLCLPLAARAQDAGARADAPAGPTAQEMVDAARGDARVIGRASGRERRPVQRVVSVALPEGECFTLLGAATGAAQVRARVSGRAVALGDAVPLANSRGEAARATLCSDVPGPYHVDVDVEGESEWALAFVAADRPERDAGARVARVGDDRLNPDAGSAFTIGEGHDFIASEVRRFAQTRPGRVAITALEREALATNAVHTQSLTLASGRCVDVVAAGVPSVADLAMELLDPTGHRVAQDSTHRGVESLRYCPSYGGRYTVRVRVFAGSGLVGVQALAER